MTKDGGVIGGRLARSGPAAKVLAAGIAAVVLCYSASAHDLWIESDGREQVCYRGHARSDHAGADYLEYDPDDVVRAACFDEAGKITGAVACDVYPARVAGGCAASYFLLSTGYWTKTPHGTMNEPKNGVDQVVRSWLSYEGVKRLERWSQALALPLTNDLELVPLNDPFGLREGDKLRLLVTLDGAAVAGAVVAYGGKSRGLSGEDGTVNVRIRHGGFQSVAASLSVPLESEMADEVVHTTFLNFELEVAE